MRKYIKESLLDVVTTVNNALLYAAFSGFGKSIGNLRNCLIGKQVIVVGNAPSLLQYDLTALDGKPLILLNLAAKLVDRMGHGDRTHLVVDINALRECGGFRSERITRYVRAHTNPRGRLPYRQLLRKSNLQDTYYLRHRHRWAMGARLPVWNCDNRVEMVKNVGALPFRDVGLSVAFSAIQLARFMGADRIVLLGVDFSYGKTGGENHAVRSDTVVPNAELAKKALVMINTMKQFADRLNVDGRTPRLFRVGARESLSFLPETTL
jgi:uncharacterized Rossmann fold enzyme